jgi:hypothetical protein
MDAKTQTKSQTAPPDAGAQQTSSRSANEPLQAILERARQGDATVLPQLKRALDENPSIWRDCYNLVEMAEQSWIDAIVGKDLLASQSLRRHVEQLKLDLVGASPPPLEKLLADRIAAAWLGVHHAELSEAFGDASGGKVAVMRQKRLDGAHKRFLSATKALVVARRLTNGLKIEINHTSGAAVSPATNRPSSTSGEADPGEAVRERLRTMFKDDVVLTEGMRASEVIA